MKRVASEEGSALPLAIAVVAFGISTLLLASRVTGVTVAKEKLQLTADSMAWRYSRDATIKVPGQQEAFAMAEPNSTSVRVEITLSVDGKTVIATVCETNPSVCATAEARSSVQAQRP